MKISVYFVCEGTSTERPVLSIAGCHIYIHVFVCVCVCVYVCVCRRWLLAGPELPIVGAEVPHGEMPRLSH